MVRASATVGEAGVSPVGTGPAGGLNVARSERLSSRSRAANSARSTPWPSSGTSPRQSWISRSAPLSPFGLELTADGVDLPGQVDVQPPEFVNGSLAHLVGSVVPIPSSFV